MDLALELGMTKNELSLRMTEGELQGWMRYGVKRSFPTRRVEMYLAQLAMVVARSAGAEVKLGDFILDFDIRDMLDVKKEEEEEEFTVEEVQQAFKFAPRMKRKK